MAENSDQIVEHLFRSEYGKLVAALTRLFGTHHIQLAEDIVQETLITALDHWSQSEIPDNPTGWLMQVAKRKALNELKRNQMIGEHHQRGDLVPSSQYEIDTVFLPDEIEDNQLRMIFTCCHPELSTESQIMLTLKTLCGFGIKEVAHALLTNEAAVNKRLYRAKTAIKTSDIPFDIPQGKDIEKQLDTVAITLYLLFNEGYNSSVSNSIIRKELCLEAMRLSKLLVNHFEEHAKLSALLALMCFHVARFDARLDDRGAIILFEDQDRSLWNQDLINSGMGYLKKSMIDNSLSAYHIEACIAAEHCIANSFQSTDWQSIYHQYQLLEKLKPNPIIKLNLAIIKSELEGIDASLKELQKLEDSGILGNYHLLPATQGIFNMKQKNFGAAIRYLMKAKDQNPSKGETNFIDEQIQKCKKMLPMA